MVKYNNALCSITIFSKIVTWYSSMKTSISSRVSPFEFYITHIILKVFLFFNFHITLVKQRQNFLDDCHLFLSAQKKKKKKSRREFHRDRVKRK